MTFKKGYGYWDLTKYPYGGDFKRFADNTTGEEIKGTVNTGSEIRVKLNDGRIIITDIAAINE